jgi:hypothetical protein
MDGRNRRLIAEPFRRHAAAVARTDRRRRFVRLYWEFKARQPEYSPVRMIARAERISVWLVYDVLRGRR